MNSYVVRVLGQLQETYPWEKEFLQAAREVLESLSLLMDKEPKYERHAILERITEPERNSCRRREKSLNPSAC